MKSVVVIEKHNASFIVKGDITFNSVKQLRQQGDRLIKNNQQLIFDFRAVQKWDSSGLALMLAWLRQAKKLQKTISFTNLPRSFRSLANLCSVSSILGMD